MNKLWTVGVPIVAACAGLSWAVSTIDRAEAEHRKPAETLRSFTAEKRSAARIYLTEAQNRAALTNGLIDKPVTSLLRVDHPLQFGELIWNDKGVPQGTAWVRVDLERQLISVFRAGHEIGTALIVYGGENKETPVGKLHVLSKARVHTSSLYDAEMPYTLRLTNDGISIHASDVRPRAATHGCIGIPLEFAKKLFSQMSVGDEVLIVGKDGRSTA